MLHYGGRASPGIDSTSTHLVTVSLPPPTETSAPSPDTDEDGPVPNPGTIIAPEQLLQAVAEGGGMPALTALRALFLQDKLHVVTSECGPSLHTCVPGYRFHGGQ